MTEAVCVIGGGWAGLAAAVALTRRGARVRLLEAGPQLGGRARRVDFDGLAVDNGPHIFIGAYTALLGLMADVGTDARVIRRSPLALQWLEAEGGAALSAPRWLPAPLHLAAALALARGLSVRDKLSSLHGGWRLRWPALTPHSDMPVAQWLRASGQSPRLIRVLWEPLCLAALNTSIATASAQVFQRVIRDAFMRGRADSDLLLPCADLSALLPDPAERWLRAQGADIQRHERVEALHIEHGRLTGLVTRKGAQTCRQAVLAVPFDQAAPLLAPHAALAPIAQRLDELRHEPIASVYLRYPPATRLPRPQLGALGTVTRGVFDRAAHGQPGLLSVIISAGGPHMALEGDALAAQVHAELRALLPDLPQPLAHKVIRDKRATFACTVGVNALRPAAATPITGLALAGDYTATGYPATLEGAVRSGLHAARALLTPP
jgi:squalene-associated FAD-dependent desaturase